MSRRVTVDTTSTHWCAKCGLPSSKSTPITRHHKGYDSLVGKFHRGISLRYLSWLDCVYLCLECHCIIHFIYEPYLEKWINRSPMGANLMRSTLIGVCDKWLSGAIATPKIPKAYRKQFFQSWESWKLSEEERKTVADWLRFTGNA